MKMIAMKISRLLAGSAAGLVSLALLTACGTDTTTTPSDDPASTTEAVGVATSIYPYQWLVEQVGGEGVDSELLIDAEGDAHDLELTPRQTAAVGEADLIVYQRTLTPSVDAAVDSGTGGAVVETGALLGEPAAGVEEEHAADDEHAHEEGDPHVWLDPTNMVTIAEAMRDELVSIDPNNAATYRANTEAVVAELTALDEEFSAGLAQCEISVFVPSHAAFGHLAERYGLEQVAVRGLDASVEPSAARIAEVQDIAAREGVTTIFYETAVSPAVSEAIANDAGLRTDVLDPLSAPAVDDSRGTDYPSRMRSNLEALRTANGCR